MRRRALWGVLALLTAATSSAIAAPPGEGPAGDAAPPAADRGYSGVTLNSGAPPPSPSPPAGLQFATWPGFRTGPEGSEVFVQLTGSVAHTLKQRGNRVTVELRGVRVPRRNNLRPVITEHFQTPVRRFQLRPIKGNRCLLELQLRRKARPRVELRPSGNYTFLVVAFPPSAGPSPDAD
ncbi:MAG: hypothetical protein IT371_18325 [Deltaproteobacteria bacterium]|nr:hypothetical protein [Deltaproteobacteria bacterium]